MSLSGPIALSPAPLTDPAGARLDPVQGVTILMATRNGAVNLGAQLDSFLAQTHPPAQVIVSDDGSRDGTVAMLARFALKLSTLPSASTWRARKKCWACG